MRKDKGGTSKRGIKKCSVGVVSVSIAAGMLWISDDAVIVANELNEPALIKQITQTYKIIESEINNGNLLANEREEKIESKNNEAKAESYDENASGEIEPEKASYTTVLRAAAPSERAAATVSKDVLNALQSVEYEDLYTFLSPYVSFADREAVRAELRKQKGGVNPTEDELNAGVRKFYMDSLDMRDSFKNVKDNLQTLLEDILNKSSNYDDNTIIANKNKILLGLALLERQYNFSFGEVSAKDIILLNPQLITAGGSQDALQNIINIGSLSGKEAELLKSADLYAKKIAPITQIGDIATFIERGVALFSDKVASEWFNDESKAHIVETQSTNGSSELFNKLKSDNTLKNHIIPLLTLSADNIYVISTTNTISYGLVDTYVDRQSDSTKQAFLTSLQDTANHQQKFLDFWYSITNKKDELKKWPTIVAVDSLQKYSSSPNAVARDLWSSKTGENAVSGVKEFITPLNLYRPYMMADGEASGNKITYFIAKALTDRGRSVYSHETTHVLDKKIWFDGYDRRATKGAEVFARGIFESINNLQSGYQPIFNLNTIYTLSENRVQNKTPERFQSEDDLKQYMQGLLDVLYTLDYIEALAILEKTPEERAVLLNKVNFTEDSKKSGAFNDNFEHITSEEAGQLTTIYDFIDRKIVSGRLEFKGIDTVGTTSQNDYLVVPLLEPIYAALQNNSGSTGDLTFKRNAYEILGEYGYTNGMSAYLSGRYANDEEALRNILDAKYNGDLSAFKKDMFKRRIENIDRLKNTEHFTDVDDLLAKMKSAVTADLATMTANKQQREAQPGAAYRVGIVTNATAVRSLKQQILSSYLNSTNDFAKSIYEENETANILYAREGEETSKEGMGTLENPYHSLSYALEKAKDGDTIKLVEDVLYRQQNNDVFKIDKAVTIDGQNNKLSFRGSNLSLENNVTFKNMTLNMIPEGVSDPKIYVSGNEVTFDNVSTFITQIQSNVRPTIIGGSHDGGVGNGNHTKINIIGGSSETRFKRIIAGSEGSDSDIPVTITIQSEFAKVDDGIILGGANNFQVTESARVISDSKNIKSIDARNTISNEVVLKSHIFSNMNLQNIIHLTLSDNADLTLSNVANISGHLTVENGSKLWINREGGMSIGNLKGSGEIKIRANSSLSVDGDVEDDMKITVQIFESELSNYVNKNYLKVEGNINESASVNLSASTAEYSLQKLDGSNTYRLVPSSTPSPLPSPTTRDEVIQYKTRYVADDTKDVGYVSETGGSNGTKRFTTTYSRNAQGDIVATEDEGTVVVDAVDKVITKGTKTKVDRINPVEKGKIYEGDENSSEVAGTKLSETQGSDGYTVRTTSYVMDSQGNITSSSSEDVVAPSDSIIKISTKPFVRAETISLTENDVDVIYDTTLAKDQRIEIPGEEGISTYTDRYRVNRSTGALIEETDNVGVVTKAKKNKIVRIGIGESVVTPKKTVYRADDTKPVGFEEVVDQGSDHVVDAGGNVIVQGRNRIVVKGTKSKEEVQIIPHKKYEEKLNPGEKIVSGKDGEIKTIRTYTLNVTTGDISEQVEVITTLAEDEYIIAVPINAPTREEFPEGKLDDIKPSDEVVTGSKDKALEKSRAAISPKTGDESSERGSILFAMISSLLGIFGFRRNKRNTK